MRALAWLADEEIGVVNISLAGPPNRLVEAAVAALAAKGHIVVAAAGNAGPAAGVAYPAAYDGVVAVTAVDAQRKIQLDAARGIEIAFAALGVDLCAADPGTSYGAVTGTSFAAPIVAARFARLLDRPDPAAAAHIYDVLAVEALDLGDPGRDPVFGHGYLAAQPAVARAALR